MSEVLLFLAVLPSILLGNYIYKMDKLEKEPKNLLTKLFLLGVGAALITIIISTLLAIVFPILNNENSTNYIELFIAIFIGVAFIEEFFKWFFLRIVTWNNKEFNHIYDAIVYAVFVSLGFATFENLLYVFSGGIWVALIRAVLSVPGHVFDGIFMGYFYGISKQAQIDQDFTKKKVNMFLSLLVPILLHGLFDYLLYIGSLLALGIYFIYIIFLYIFSFKIVKNVSAIMENMKAYYCMTCGFLCKSNYCPKCGSKTNFK